jgi:hypothetical protein
MASSTERTERTEQTDRAGGREVDVTDRPARSTDAPFGPPRAAAAVGNGAAIAAFVVGMLSATFAFLIAPAPGAVLFGIVAIGLGFKGVSVANRLGGVHKGLAITGIVAGVLGLLLGVAVIVGGIALWNEIEQSDLPNEIQQLVD